MTDFKFCSKESKYLDENVQGSWAKLLEEKQFCDITLACEDGQKIDAHRIILSSFSPVFENILKNVSHSHPVIFLRNVDYFQILYLIKFIYKGEVHIPQQQLEEFLKIGHDMKIPNLARIHQEKDLQHVLGEKKKGKKINHHLDACMD